MDRSKDTDRDRLTDGQEFHRVTGTVEGPPHVQTPRRIQQLSGEARYGVWEALGDGNVTARQVERAMARYEV